MIKEAIFLSASFSYNRQQQQKCLPQHLVLASNI